MLTANEYWFQLSFRHFEYLVLALKKQMGPPLVQVEDLEELCDGLNCEQVET